MLCLDTISSRAGYETQRVALFALTISDRIGLSVEVSNTNSLGILFVLSAIPRWRLLLEFNIHRNQHNISFSRIQLRPGLAGGSAPFSSIESIICRGAIAYTAEVQLGGFPHLRGEWRPPDYIPTREYMVLFCYRFLEGVTGHAWMG